jgi:serine phosphatase RsbU (regulator of sigma subunit)/ligand-binding sensor domain-containing protein
MKKIILLFNALFFIINLNAQVNEFGYPLSRYYSPTEINSNGQNWAVAQAPNGIIYVANNLNGVLEYDGETWRRISIIGEPEVRAIGVSESGIVYVGCSSEFGYLQPTNDGNYNYKKVSGYLPDSLNNFSTIYNIHIISDTVYFEDNKFRLFGYIPEKDTILIVNTPKYTLFTFQLDKQLYGGSFTEGLFKMQDNNPVAVNGGDFYKSKDIFSIMEDRSSKIVVTGNNGIYKYNEQTGGSTQLLGTETRKEFQDITFYSAGQDRNSIFVGSLGGGIVVFNKNGVLKSKLNREIGIPDDVCTSVKNFNNTVWGTLQLGLVSVEYANPLRFFGESSGLNGIVNDIISFKGKLFVGTDIGLYYLTFDENEIPKFKKVSGIDNQVFSLCIMSNSKLNKEMLLIGTTIGIYQLNDLNHSVISVEENLIGIDRIFPKIEKDKLKSVKLYVYKLFASNNSNLLWCGTADRLIAIKYDENGKWNATEAIYDLGGRVESINEDNLSNIYASIVNGLIKVNQSTYANQIIDSLSGLPATTNFRVFKYNNSIALTTSAGIYMFNTSKNRFEKFKGIPDEYVNGELAINRYCQLSDSSLVLAVSKANNSRIDFLRWTDNRYKLEPDKFKRIRNIDTEVFFEQDSHIWFSSSTGIFNMDLNSDYQVDSSFNCLIRKVVGRDSTYFYGNFINETKTGLIVSETQLEGQKPILKYSQNDLTFHFAAPFFEADDEIVYSYKLKGFKEQWSKWDKEPKAVFTNLNAGEYTFNVKAKNIYDIESNIGTYSFSILPPWYRTIVAYIGYVILALLAVWLIVKLYTRKLKQEKIWLEGVVRERTAEIREQRDEIAEQKQSIEDSILYARRIQRAILPSKELADSVLPEYFILFRPRDIVSGDYYWINKIGHRTIVVAADCTGHGVPGAFMSMLGLSFLNEIILQENIVDAHLILNKLRERIKRTLRQEGKEGEAKDGMDVALVVVDEMEKKLYYAGAYNPAYIYRGTELVEMKADRMPIGIYIKEKDSFTLNEYDYLPGDTFYIASDGYADQFGGPKKEKLKSKAMKEYLASIQDKPMEEQRELLNQHIEDWMGPDQEQIDDMVVIGVRMK